MRRERHQIVNVQKMPPRQIFPDPKPRNGNHPIRPLHKGQPVTTLFLTPNTGNKIVFCNVRAKLTHYGVTSSNFCVGCGNANVHVCCYDTYRQYHASDYAAANRTYGLSLFFWLNAGDELINTVVALAFKPLIYFLFKS